MEKLGNFNLFCSSHDGSSWFGNPSEVEEEFYINWKNFKRASKNFGNKITPTDFTAFPKIMKYQDFLEGFKSKLIQYQNEFPDSEKEDFLNYVYGFSRFELERFIKMNFSLLGFTPNEDFLVYRFFNHDFKAYEEYVIPSNKSVDHYIQFYKKVLQHFQEFEYLNQPIENSLNPIQNLTVSEIALFLYYSGRTPQRGNNSLEKEFEKSSNSIYNEYSKIVNKSNRLKADTLKTGKNQLERFEKIEPLIKEKHSDFYLELEELKEKINRL